MPNLAIFDLDYTLTQKGTWGRFMARAMRGRPIGFTLLWIHAGVAQLRYKLGLIPRIAVKRTMMSRSIAGLPKDRIEAIAKDFADAEVPEKLNGKVMGALKAHQAAGDTVLIASAAVDVLVNPIAARLNVTQTVSTAMGWTGQNTLSPDFASKNCYGAEKLERIKAWLERQDGSEFDHITAYSDSRSDAPMLEFADKAIVVKPNRKTRRYAMDRDFEIWD